MPVSYADKNVLCPFYKETEPRKIRCEGYTEETSEVTTFPTDNAKKDFLDGSCCGDYQNCPKFKALWNKYE